MCQETRFNHIALEYEDKKQSDTFFKEVLSIAFEKSFKLPEILSKKIFGIHKEIDVYVYNNGKTKFEVFLTGNKRNNKNSFEHICIEVKDKDILFEKCKKYNLEIITVEKNTKKIYFIKDFSNYLYEVK